MLHAERICTDAKAAADRLALQVNKAGLDSLKSVTTQENTRISLLINLPSDDEVLSTLHKFATNKKSGFERESAAIAFQGLATSIGAPIAPLLLPSLPILFELYADKGEVVRTAATAATKSILKLFPPEATSVVFRTLEDILAKGKWQTKIGVLDALKSFVPTARDPVAAELGHTLPKVESAMHDTKKEVNNISTEVCN